MPTLPPDYTAQLNQIAKNIEALKSTVPSYAPPLIGAFCGACLAFLFAILAEPLKSDFARWRNRKRMRDDLYTLFAAQYRKILGLDFNLASSAAPHVTVSLWATEIAEIDLVPLDTRMNVDGTLLHTLTEYEGLHKFLLMTKRLQEHATFLAQSDLGALRNILKPLMDDLRLQFDTGRIDEAKVIKLGHFDADRNMREALKLAKKRGLL